MKLIKQIDCAEAIYEALRTPILKGTFTDTMSLAASLVKEVPTIEAEPIKHGRWICINGWVHCSVCHQEPPSESNIESDYCPNCGAKMGKTEERKNFIDLGNGFSITANGMDGGENE